MELIPNNAKYLSHEVQDEILAILSDMVLVKIHSECIEAKWYSVSADETKDNSKKEILTIVLRYFENSSSTVVERFVGFNYLGIGLGADAITNVIIGKIEADMKLSLQNCLSTTFDGASTMSGHITGVQAQLRRHNSSILYTHCFNHVLNLCLVHAVKSVTSVSYFFDLLQSLYVFISGSALHAKFLEIQTKLSFKRVIELKRQCETRWACRASSIEAIFNTYPAIIQTLEWAISQGGTRAVDSKGLLFQIMNFDFVLQLHSMKKIFNTTLALSNVLQSKDLDLAKACILVDATIEELEELKSDEMFEMILSDAVEFADAHIDQESIYSRPKRQRRMPEGLNDSIVYESTGNEVRDKGELKRSYGEAIDTVMQEMRQRFDVRNKSIMRAIQALIPGSEMFFVLEAIQPLATQYSIDTEKLEVELPLASKVVHSGIARILAEKQCQNVCGDDTNSTSTSEGYIVGLTDVICSLAGYEVVFPATMTLLKMAITLGVSSATGERSFSCVKRIKTFLRSTMTTKRLSALALLSVEKELASSLNMDEFINTFATNHNNRRITLL